MACVEFVWDGPCGLPNASNHLQLSTYINLKGSDLTEPNKNAPIGHGFLLQIPQTRDGIGMALVFYIICILVFNLQLQRLQSSRFC